mgnify:FL=1
MINKIKQEETISKHAIKFANTVFYLGITCSILLIIFSIYRIYEKKIFFKSIELTDALGRFSGKAELKTFSFFQNLDFTIYHKVIVMGLILIIFFFLILILKNNIKINLSILFSTLIICTYSTELFLTFYIINPVIFYQNLYKFRKNYDERTTLEVIEELNQSGIKAYPNITPRKVFNLSEIEIVEESLKTNNGENKIYPLSGISRTTTIFSNELGFFPIIETDEHGFNNPKGLYEKNEMDLMIIGDSFAEGINVNADENISSILRSIDSNLKIINLGKQGHGPLLEFATIKEYGQFLKPKIILWFYYINDISELEDIKLLWPSMFRYLSEESFSQNLILKQKEVDYLLINYVEEKIKQEKIDILKQQKVNIKVLIPEIFKLLKLRLLFDYIVNPPNRVYDQAPEDMIKTFNDILQKTKKMISSWDGKLYFIYLPSFDLYSKNQEDINRETILNTVKTLQIPIIDIQKEVFDIHPDPISLFPFKMNGHYTVEGYNLISKIIYKRIYDDGLLSY